MNVEADEIQKLGIAHLGEDCFPPSMTSPARLDFPAIISSIRSSTVPRQMNL